MLVRTGTFSHWRRCPSFRIASFVLYRAIHTPPGGFVEDLPTSFGRPQGKGSVSNANGLRRRLNMAQVRRNKRKLRSPGESPADSAVGKEQIERLLSRVRSIEEGHQTCTPNHPRHAVRRSTEQRAMRSSVMNSRIVDEDTKQLTTDELHLSSEGDVEDRFAVPPQSTVFGSDLDRLERDMMRDFHQRGARLPRPDAAFMTFGSSNRGNKLQWEPSSSFQHMQSSGNLQQASSPSTGLGSKENHNLSSHIMHAIAFRRAQDQLTEDGQRTADASSTEEATPQSAFEASTNDEDLPEHDNPHFPTSHCHEQPHVDTDADLLHRMQSSSTSIVEVDIRSRSKPSHTIVAHSSSREVHYDAFNQRPAELRLPHLRGADYWDDANNRAVLDSISHHRDELFEQEQLEEGAVDTSEVEYSTNAIRKETFLFFQAHPINEMIQEKYVRLRQIDPADGGPTISFSRDQALLESPITSPPPTTEVVEALTSLDGSMEDLQRLLQMDIDLPVEVARRLAKRFNADLIRCGAIHTNVSDRRIIAICRIGDHREQLRDMIKFKIQKLGVQPPPTKQCIEVPFRGGTHPHAIRYKCAGVAKHLLHRHAIRLNLTKFGSPAEGFPVFQSILDEVKNQCLRLKAYHKAGQIRSTYNEIFCYLYPSTGRSPKTTVDHPTPVDLNELRDHRMLEEEKEIFFDDLQSKITAKDRLRYLTKVENGTAWADKDEGLSLQRQRALKVMLGYLPKGNRELYAARGDVNIPAPFRSSHPTSTERWSYPLESNLEQASRGAAVLGKRASMPVSDMHDRGETPENPSDLDRFYYKVQGPALELGEFKEALGLKDNRKKIPPLGSGFATIGVGNGGGPSTPFYTNK